MKLKAAIIGYGYWGPKLARNFLNSSKFQINYVVDNKPNNLIKAKNEIPLAIGLNNLDEIKAQNLDLIIYLHPQ
jgi:predicted dehydrogenase